MKTKNMLHKKREQKYLCLLMKYLNEEHKNWEKYFAQKDFGV